MDFVRFVTSLADGRGQIQRGCASQPISDVLLVLVQPLDVAFNGSYVTFYVACPPRIAFHQFLERFQLKKKVDLHSTAFRKQAYVSIRCLKNAQDENTLYKAKTIYRYLSCVQDFISVSFIHHHFKRWRSESNTTF